MAVLWQLYGLLQAVPRSAHIRVFLQARINLRQHVSPLSAQCLDNISGALDNCSKHPATQAKRYTYTATDKAGSCPSNVMTQQQRGCRWMLSYVGVRCVCVCVISREFATQLVLLICHRHPSPPHLTSLSLSIHASICSPVNQPSTVRASAFSRSLCVLLSPSRDPVDSRWQWRGHFWFQEQKLVRPFSINVGSTSLLMPVVLYMVCKCRIMFLRMQSMRNLKYHDNSPQPDVPNPSRRPQNTQSQQSMRATGHLVNVFGCSFFFINFFLCIWQVGITLPISTIIQPVERV